LNKLFAGFESWRVADIMARAEILVEPVFAIWPYFGASSPKNRSRRRGTPTVRIEDLRKTLVVSTWRDVLENTVNE